MKTKLESFLGYKYRNGYALFIVLAVVSIAGVMATLIADRTTGEIYYSHVFKNKIRSYHAAASVESVVVDILKNDSNGWDGYGDDWYEPISYGYEGLYVSVRVSDECGKININKVEQSAYFEMFKNLLSQLNLPESIAYSTRDWIDKDDELSDYGAERSYYSMYGYAPSNENFKSVYEFLYVKGVDKSVFSVLKKFVTIYGDGKINVNSASRQVLMSIDPELTQSVAESIIEARPIKSLEKLRDIPGITPEVYFRIKPFVTVSCDYFSVEAFAESEDVRSTIIAFTDRNKILEWKVLW